MRERFLALYCLAIGAFTFIVLMVPGSGGTQSAYAYPKAAFTPPKPNMGHEPVDDQDQRGASDTAQSSVGKGYLPAGGTPTPPPSCGSDADYIITQSTGAIIDPGTTLVPGSQCNQPCTSTITLPFPYRFYGQIFTQIIVGENGTMAFTANPNTANNTCLPRTIYENAIMPHWDDLDTRASVDPDLGIYVSTRGSPPSRIFNIEWRACRYGAGACDGRVNFEVRLFENLDTFEIIYGEVANSGNSATVGIQRGTGQQVSQFTCLDPDSVLQSGLRLTFTQPQCPTSTPTLTGTSTPVNTPTHTRTPTSTVTGTPPTVTATRTATTDPCLTQNYQIATAAGTIVPGTTNTGSNCDDCVTTITIPFSFRLYDQTFTSAQADSNGKLHFPTGASVFTNSCLPQTGATYTIYPYWDDLRTDGVGGTCPAGGCGIFTSVTGTAPNRIFNIEWRTVYFTGGGTANFEVRLYETAGAGTNSRFEIVYGTLTNGNSSATGGVQRNSTSFTQDFCDGVGGPATGVKIYTLGACGTAPVGTATAIRTATSGGVPSATRTSTGAAGTATSVPSRTSVPPTRTATPSATQPPPCGPSAPYAISTATGVTIDSNKVLLDGSRCDDCMLTPIVPPFPGRLYGQTFNSINISSNGNLQFSTSDSEENNSCIPTYIFPNAVLPHWDDLNTVPDARRPDRGIYTLTTGVAPNRNFLIEWRACQYDGGQCVGEVSFEVRLYEGQDRFDFVYGAVVSGGANASHGLRGPADLATFNSCNSTLFAGLQITFIQPQCATGTPVPTFTNTTTMTATRTAEATITTVTTTSTAPATITATTEPCTVTFSDVPPNHTFYPWIRCLACLGIISGYADGTFLPGNNITRGQIAKVVSNAAGLTGTPTGQTYEDVLPTNTFYVWIERLSALGVMGGYPCGQITQEPCIPPQNRPYFRPQNNATRGQISKIVAEAANLGGSPTGQTFEDVPTDHPFYVWIERLTSRGVISGYPCGSPGEPCLPPLNRPYFRPGNNVTRGQAAKIVANTFFPGCHFP
jgi:hypothetical protein